MKLGFDDCPLHCSNGKLMDYNIMQLVPCPHCSEKRKELAKEGVVEMEDGEIKELHSILGINNKYLNPKFVYEAVVPDGEMVFIEEESIDNQKRILEDIYLGLSVGDLPESSYCIGLGIKGRIDRLAYPFLTKAYLTGLSVARFISCSEYNRLCVNMSPEIGQYYDKDLVMMLIPDGASKVDIASAKGLMQIRALNGKPTIFVTAWVIEACSMLLGYYDDDTYFLARGVFLEYKHSKNSGKSHYIRQLTGVENEVFHGEAGKSDTNMVSMADLLK